MPVAKKPTAAAPQDNTAIPTSDAPSGVLNAQLEDLRVTGHLMTLPPGLFCIINEAKPDESQHHGLPGVRIAPPPINGDNVEIVGFRGDGWLGASGDAVLVRIKSRPGQVMVSIYQFASLPDAAPKLQVRQLLGETPSAAAAHTATPQSIAPAPAPQKADVVAHIQTRGDIGAVFGNWLGEKGSNNWVEGFTIIAPEGIAPEDLTYQAVLGRGWLSPWVEAGQYCGSRGMALPLLGLRVRLSGAAAQKYDISCSAAFIGGSSSGPVGNDETCEAEALAPLEALNITLTARSRKPASKSKN